MAASRDPVLQHPFYAWLNEEIDPDCSCDANFQHLLHMFIGYVAGVRDDEESQPYAPGSARDVSYQIGRRRGEQDFREGS